MSGAHAIVVVLTALAAGAGAWAGPAVLRRLPEPPPDPQDRPDEVDAGADGGSDGVEEPEPQPGPPVPEKIPYAVLADRPGLAPRLAVPAALAAGSAAAVLGPNASLPVWAFLAALGVLLSFVDWTTRLLPFLLVAPAYPVVGVLLLGASAVTGDWDALLRAAVGWLGVLAVFWLMWFLYRRGLGYGDVRLSGVLGMALGWLGWQHLVLGLYAAFLVGAVVGVALVALKVVDRRGFAFGPFLLVGTWLGVVLPSTLAAAFG